MMTEREFATECVRDLQRAGFVAYFAGGCVRDELLKIPPADFDIATSATPQQVKEVFRRCHSFGASFGVVEAIGPRGSDGEWLKVQIATFRSDGEYSDGRRPDTVVFSSPEEDAARRDFTINGMFLDPVSQTIIDYVDGQNDLKNKVLRAIGDPHSRFREDKLRLLRAVRMAARFELEFDPITRDAVQSMASSITVVSAERITEELRKILKNQHRTRGVELLNTLGLMDWILPQNTGWLEPTAAKPVSFELGMAILHRGVDSKTINRVCRRLKLSNDECEAISWLITTRERLWNASMLRNHQIYPVLIQPGIRDLITLMHTEGHHEDAAHCERLIREKSPQELNPDPLVTGDDLIALGFQPGPRFKSVLQQIRDAQLDGEITHRDTAVHKTRELLAD